jgi:hypothetical protein
VRNHGRNRDKGALSCLREEWHSQCKKKKTTKIDVQRHGGGLGLVRLGEVGLWEWECEWEGVSVE